MKKALLAIALLPLLSACASGSKYSAMKPEFGGQVEFPKWPALQAGVIGYNLYISTSGRDPWEKITDTPIKGGNTMVPYLEPGVEYYFRLTSVNDKGQESRPGGAFKRKAVAK